MDFLTLPGISGWPSTVFTIIVLILGLIYINKSAKNKAKTVAEEAQKSAIDAMKAEIDILRVRMEDERKENALKIQSAQRETTRLEHTIEALISAMAKIGFIITISGDMIAIEVQDNAKKVTMVRIQDAKDKTA